jgi:hypothetical protein
VQVKHPSELNQLTPFRLLRTSGRGTIRLAPEFEHPEKEQWEADINRFYYACGCSSGAKGLLAMLLLGAGGSAIALAANAISLQPAILLPIGAAAAGAAIGKLAGLARAHRRLKRVVHTVQAHWKPRTEQEKPIYACG